MSGFGRDSFGFREMNNFASCNRLDDSRALDEEVRHGPGNGAEHANVVNPPQVKAKILWANAEGTPHAPPQYNQQHHNNNNDGKTISRSEIAGNHDLQRSTNDALNMSLESCGLLNFRLRLGARKVSVKLFASLVGRSSSTRFSGDGR